MDYIIKGKTVDSCPINNDWISSTRMINHKRPLEAGWYPNIMTKSCLEGKRCRQTKVQKQQ